MCCAASGSALSAAIAAEAMGLQLNGTRDKRSLSNAFVFHLGIMLNNLPIIEKTLLRRCNSTLV
jgi:hypothetical protein